MRTVRCERCHKKLTDYSVHNDYILPDCMASMRVCKECSDEWDAMLTAYLERSEIMRASVILQEGDNE